MPFEQSSIKEQKFPYTVNSSSLVWGQICISKLYEALSIRGNYGLDVQELWNIAWMLVTAFIERKKKGDVNKICYMC